MEKKILFFITIMVSFLFLNSVFADPGLTSNGRPGGMKVFSAEPFSKGSFSLGVQREYFRSKDVQFKGKNDLHTNQAFIHYVPFSAMQLFITQRTLLNHNDDILSQLHSVDISKTELGTLISFPVSKNYFIGIEPQYILFNGNGVGLLQASSAALRLLNTYTYSAEKQTLRLHLNSQYFYDRSRKTVEGFNFSFFNQNQLYGVTNYSSLQHGIGAELDMSGFNPFIEYTLDYILRPDRISLFRNPNRLTFGTKIHQKNSPWLFNVGAEYGLSHKKRHEFVTLTPKMNIFAGLVFTDLPKAAQTSEKEKEIEPQAKVKVENVILEEPKPLYPIYPVTGQTITEEVIIKRIIRKRIKKKKPVEVVEPKTTETPKSTETPKTEVKEPEVKLPESTNSFPTQDSYKNYSEEAPNKNFLINFR